MACNRDNRQYFPNGYNTGFYPPPPIPLHYQQMMMQMPTIQNGYAVAPGAVIQGKEEYKDNKLWLWILLAVIAFVLIGASIYFLNKSRQEKKKQEDALLFEGDLQSKRNQAAALLAQSQPQRQVRFEDGRRPGDSSSSSSSSQIAPIIASSSRTKRIPTSNPNPSTLRNVNKNPAEEDDSSNPMDPSPFEPKKNSKKSDALLGFFGEEDGPSMTPGQGMHKSFAQGKSDRKWKPMPVGPMDEDGRLCSGEEFDPDTDDVIYVPPTVTLEDARNAKLRDEALKPIEERINMNTKKNGKSGYMELMNPRPKRTGIYKSKTQIPFGLSEEEVAQSSDAYNPYLGSLDQDAMRSEMRKDAVYGGISSSAISLDEGNYQSAFDGRGSISGCNTHKTQYASF